MEHVTITFRGESQSIGALREAAYRLIGKASCKIDSEGGVHVCVVSPAKNARLPESDLRARFLDLVTDENLREKLQTETAPTRNLILALAFGALVEDAGPVSVS